MCKNRGSVKDLVMIENKHRGSMKIVESVPYTSFTSVSFRGDFFLVFLKSQELEGARKWIER